MPENISLTEDEVTLLSRQAEDRSKIYLLLSTFYLRRPREEFVNKIKSKKFIQNLKKAFSGDGSKRESSLEDGLNALESFIKSINGVPEQDVAENLAIEFTKLFRGIKEGYGPPPPYESVWRGEGRVMGECTQKVLQIYQASGVGMDLEDELPDYLGIELKFMAILSYHEAEAWRKQNIQEAQRFVKLQKEFLKEHILQWVTEFCKKMEEETENLFYKGCALLTRGFLEIDKEFMTIK